MFENILAGQIETWEQFISTAFDTSSHHISRREVSFRHGRLFELNGHSRPIGFVLSPFLQLTELNHSVSRLVGKKSHRLFHCGTRRTINFPIVHTISSLTFANIIFADLCDWNTAKQQTYVIEACELWEKVCVRVSDARKILSDDARAKTSDVKTWARVDKSELTMIMPSHFSFGKKTTTARHHVTDSTRTSYSTSCYADFRHCCSHTQLVHFTWRWTEVECVSTVHQHFRIAAL